MDQLQQLAGLKLPDNISWWPVAPGWYVIVLLLFMIALLHIYRKRKKFAKNRYRREALLTLQSMDLCDACALLSVISKVLNHAYSEQLIELKEPTFINALNTGLDKACFDPQDWFLLTQLAFQPINSDTFDEAKFIVLKTKCEQWIKEHDYEH